VCFAAFRQEQCEWDTGLHYTSKAMSMPTHRAGALLRFMTKGTQHWQSLEDPYDQLVFPHDEQVATGRPNCRDYEFHTGAANVIDQVIARIDPGNETLRQQCHVWMELCTRVNQDFTALGWSRAVEVVPYLPKFLVQWLFGKRIREVYQLASYTVRDVQYVIFNLHYSMQDLLSKGITSTTRAPTGPEPDPVLRRVKAVLNHPIGDYAVQPRMATFVAQGITMAHYMQGAAYTVGPTQNISIRLSSVVRQMGGDVFCNATVERIVVEQGRAVGVQVRPTTSVVKKDTTTTSNSNHTKEEAVPVVPSQVQEIRAKHIVCATSVFNLYHKLLPRDHPVTREFFDPTKRTITQSNGHIFLFCKIQGDVQTLQLPKHNLWYMNGYDIDDAFDKYNVDPIHHRPPTVYIGFPCTKDPTWSKRLPGISNCILISDGQWEWFAKWSHTKVHERGKDYEHFKAQLTKHLLDVLYEVVPQVQGHVVYSTLGTPLTDVSYLSSFQGGSYGTRCDTNIFTELNSRWTTTPQTPIPGLYMAGSDAFLPAVCGAMYGGILGAVRILGPLQSLRMTLVFLLEFATVLQQEEQKEEEDKSTQPSRMKMIMTRPTALFLAIYKFCTELVAN
jgi:all-trans-retinol 13,14-reductase